MNKRQIGGGYEKAAADFLIENGYVILEMNFRCKIGEIDIVAMDGNTLAFIEVKYRKDERYGGPFSAVNLKKQKTISKVALYYIMTHGLGEATPCRFDVVGILPNHIELIKNAFDFRR